MERGDHDQEGVAGPELVVAQEEGQRIELVPVRRLLLRDVLRHGDRDPGRGHGGFDPGVHREAGHRDAEHDDGPERELDPRRPPGVAGEAPGARGARHVPWPGRGLDDPSMRQDPHCGTRTSRSFLATAATTISAALDVSGHEPASDSEPAASESSDSEPESARTGVDRKSQ